MPTEPFYQTRDEFLTLADNCAQAFARGLEMSSPPADVTCAVYAIPEDRAIFAFAGENRLTVMTAPFTRLPLGNDFEHSFAIRATGRMREIYGLQRAFADFTSKIFNPSNARSPIPMPVQTDYSSFAPAAGWPVVTPLSSYANVETREVTMHPFRVTANVGVNNDPAINDEVTSIVIYTPDETVPDGHHRRDLYTIQEGALTCGRFIGATGGEPYVRTFDLTAPAELLDLIESKYPV